MQCEYDQALDTALESVKRKMLIITKAQCVMAATPYTQLSGHSQRESKQAFHNQERALHEFVCCTKHKTKEDRRT